MILLFLRDFRGYANDLLEKSCDMVRIQITMGNSKNGTHISFVVKCSLYILTFVLIK